MLWTQKFVYNKVKMFSQSAQQNSSTYKVIRQKGKKQWEGSLFCVGATWICSFSKEFFRQKQ